ncbi:DUF167 domain-containing protein [Reyranella sp.]|uniref:DUF167 domain-containing protein n=1 Tax=Reyranella sp. TaxID=1929291 RepID=UPI003783CA44
MADPAFLRRASDGVTIELRVHPRARRTALECSGDGGLKAAVTAPAEDGKANRAVIDLLAGEWRLAKSTLSVTRGAANRDKVVKLAGEPAELAGRISHWLKEHADTHE